MFRSYFDASISGQGATDKSSPFCAAWLLFVTAKSKLLPAFPDLVASFNLLICVLNVAITHVPAPHRNVDLHDHSLFPVRTESGGTDTLQSLCLVNKANLPAVRALMHGMDNLLTEAAKAVPSTAGGLSREPSDMTTSCTFHPGFMSDPAITAAVAESLDTDYQQACARSIDVDERPFLGRAVEAPPTPGPSAAPPSMSKCLVGSPQRQATLALQTCLMSKLILDSGAGVLAAANLTVGLQICLMLMLVNNRQQEWRRIACCSHLGLQHVAYALY